MWIQLEPKVALSFFQPNSKHSEERNFVNSVHSSVNVESVKNVTFDFFNTSHSLSSPSIIQDVINIQSSHYLSSPSIIQEDVINIQSSHSLSSPSIIQEDVINDTHFIINENGSSVDEAQRQQINSNFNIVTETKAK